MSRNAFQTGLRAHFSDAQIRRLAAVRVGIAGAGGLGSNVALHLVRSGVIRLVVADFDRVTPANLNRQFFFGDQIGQRKVDALAVNLKRINPTVAVDALDLRLDADNVRPAFAACDVIVEALDDARAKKMLAEAFMADHRLLVCASGIGGWGDSDRIRTRKIRDTVYIVGDGRSAVSPDLPPTAAIVGIAAAKQADVVVDHVLHERGRTAGGADAAPPAS